MVLAANPGMGISWKLLTFWILSQFLGLEDREFLGICLSQVWVLDSHFAGIRESWNHQMTPAQLIESFSTYPLWESYENFMAISKNPQWPDNMGPLLVRRFSRDQVWFQFSNLSFYPLQCTCLFPIHSSSLIIELHPIPAHFHKEWICNAVLFE